MTEHWHKLDGARERRVFLYIEKHGFEIEFLGKMVIHPKALEFSKNLNRILENIKDSLGFFRGFEVEHKKYTASLHYRGVPIYLQQRFVKKIKSIIMPYLKNKEAVVTYGKKVIELRPPVKWNKGNAVLWILSRFKSKKVLPVYIGDDKTDEDAFKAIGNKGLTFYVGTTKPTSARYKLKNVDEVYKLLKALSPSMPY